MGMYNEVKKECPNCHKTCQIQIPQVVLGFGGFDLDMPWTTDELTKEEKIVLSYHVNKTPFYCETCNEDFYVELEVADRKKSQKVTI